MDHEEMRKNKWIKKKYEQKEWINKNIKKERRRRRRKECIRWINQGDDQVS